MASVNEKELSRIIKSGEISGVYYLYGSDRYAVGEYKKAMVKKIVSEGDETYNLHEYQGKNIDIEGISEACEAIPMFAEKLCVTVCDLDLETERPGDARMKILTETVSNLPESTVLIFYTANTDICDGKKYPTAKNKKLVDLCAKHGTVCDIAIKSRSEAVRTICAKASSLGAAMDDKAAGLLWERCCGDMLMIMNEIHKLASYSNSAPIDVKTVELLTPETGDAKAYNLADAAASGNVSRTMELYNELIENRNDPIYLLYVLTGSMNDLYRARLALDFNHTVQDVVNDFGYSKKVEFRVKNAFSAVRRTSLAHLRRCMDILAQADMDMKSGTGSPAVIIEKAIVMMLSHNG